jgi:hypothetical protein
VSKFYSTTDSSDSSSDPDNPDGSSSSSNQNDPCNPDYISTLIDESGLGALGDDINTDINDYTSGLGEPSCQAFLLPCHPRFDLRYTMCMFVSFFHDCTSIPLSGVIVL